MRHTLSGYDFDRAEQESESCRIGWALKDRLKSFFQVWPPRTLDQGDRLKRLLATVDQPMALAVEALRTHAGDTNSACMDLYNDAKRQRIVDSVQLAETQAIEGAAILGPGYLTLDLGARQHCLELHRAFPDAGDRIIETYQHGKVQKSRHFTEIASVV